ncbi:MAG: hypothetical protein P3T54_05625 [Dehalogenimonas sp.]|uniref:Uncharacterized protein n=1 Tax=Candidatus Dehalogenimonas loeffleri TaxID=3127115 RepID=A0ABZ2JBZ6_9CHLR|nr:hypothetical protein [Dehalogenimonas sp.]
MTLTELAIMTGILSILLIVSAYYWRYASVLAYFYFVFIGLIWGAGTVGHERSWFTWFLIGNGVAGILTVLAIVNKRHHGFPFFSYMKYTAYILFSLIIISFIMAMLDTLFRF